MATEPLHPRPAVFGCKFLARELEVRKRTDPLSLPVRPSAAPVGSEPPPGRTALTVRGTPVAAIMTRRIEMVAASIPVSYAARRMLDQHITAMPVTDDDGAIVGMICATDLLRAVSGMGSTPPSDAARGGRYTDIRPSVLYAPDFIRGKVQGTVREYMRPVVVSLSTDDTVQHAAITMTERGVTHALVVDKNDNLAGLLTCEDIVRHVAG